ncbi:MAG: EutN/CcmL family microcompartment protein [Myxococcales bacterium]|nr:EutN/CcmL family microcompartment protein [Myxococcales bacterium]
MRLCRVVGPMWAAVKHPAFSGRTLLVVQPLDEQGADSGASFVAVDTAQAGTGDRVIVLVEGNGARQILRGKDLPIRSVIVGVVDAVDTDQGPVPMARGAS